MKLCDLYQVDSLFDKRDIIDAIKQSNGDLKTAQEILFN